MATKKGATVRDPIGRVGAAQPAVDLDDVLTPSEAKRLRQSLKQTRQGKTRPWAGIKRELGL
jgi:hypothetical protein